MRSHKLCILTTNPNCRQLMSRIQHWASIRWCPYWPRSTSRNNPNNMILSKRLFRAVRVWFLSHCIRMLIWGKIWGSKCRGSRLRAVAGKGLMEGLWQVDRVLESLALPGMLGTKVTSRNPLTGFTKLCTPQVPRGLLASLVNQKI